MTTATPTTWSHTAQTICPALMGEGPIDSNYWGRTAPTNRGGGIQMDCADAEIVITDGDTASTAICSIPAGSLVRYACIENSTAVSYNTAVKASLGISGGDVDAYLLSGTTLTAGYSTEKVQATAVASAVSVTLNSVDTNGSAAGSFKSGTFRVRIMWEAPVAVDTQ